MTLHRTLARAAARKGPRPSLARWTAGAMAGAVLSISVPVQAAPAAAPPAPAAAPAAPAKAPAPAAPTVTAAEMHDLSSDHWAYKAIQLLVDKYGIMAGFPDMTFRGNKTVSRYELAASLAKVMQRMQALQTGTPVVGAPTVSASDKALVDKLSTEFKGELAALGDRVTKNETAIKDLQDKFGKLVTVGGHIDTSVADDTLSTGKDTAAPYITSSFSMKLKGTVSASTTYDASVSGSIKAAGSGNVPDIMGGGTGPANANISIGTARYTTKVGATTLNFGRFPLWLTGLGPNSLLDFASGNFIIGVGETSQNVSSMRVGSDVGTAVESDMGPLTVYGALNSNIIAGQIKLDLGMFALQGGYETDQKAITQNLLGSGARIKTTDNGTVVLDVGGKNPFGLTVQANMTNEALTAFGGGLRAALGPWSFALDTEINSDPGKSVTVATYSLTGSLPAQTLFGGRIHTPSLLAAAADNYTISAPPRPDNLPTTGPGGLALGKNAGVSIQLGIDNPFIPNLVFEYDAEAKLIEDVFLPNASDPITHEAFLLKSGIDF